MLNNVHEKREHSFFDDVLNYFHRAAAHTKHPAGLLDQIKN